MCRAWKSEGCSHISERTGQIKRQYRKRVEAQARAEAEGEAAALADEERLIFDALDKGDPEDFAIFAPWVITKWRNARGI